MDEAPAVVQAAVLAVIVTLVIGGAGWLLIEYLKEKNPHQPLRDFPSVRAGSCGGGPWRWTSIPLSGHSFTSTNAAPPPPPFPAFFRPSMARCTFSRINRAFSRVLQASLAFHGKGHKQIPGEKPPQFRSASAPLG